MNSSKSVRDIKNETRRNLLEKRLGISDESRLDAEKKIENIFLSLASVRFARTILLYSPIKGELDITRIVKPAADSGKRVAFPISKKDEPEMNFHFISSVDELKKGTFGIAEPPSDAEMYLLSGSESDVCVIPAVAYDRNGHRLGYGKGYYDRFLSQFRGVKIGLCMFSMLQDRLPCGKYDIPADVIVTEKGVIIPNGQK